MHEKRYMVVGFGTSKKTKDEYSKAYLIRGDKNETFGYLDQKDSYYTEDKRPLGTIIVVTMQEA